MSPLLPWEVTFERKNMICECVSVRVRVCGCQVINSTNNKIKDPSGTQAQPAQVVCYLGFICQQRFSQCLPYQVLLPMKVGWRGDHVTTSGTSQVTVNSTLPISLPGPLTSSHQAGLKNSVGSQFSSCSPFIWAPVESSFPQLWT